MSPIISPGALTARETTSTTAAAPLTAPACRQSATKPFASNIWSFSFTDPTRHPHHALSCRPPMLPRRDPVAAFRLVEIRPIDHIPKDAAVLFDRPDRADVVVVARHENATKATLVTSDLQCLTKNLGGIAPSPKFRNHDIADVSTDTIKKVIQRVPNRSAPDNVGTDERKQKRCRDMVRREVDALLLFGEHLEIPTKGHPVLIVVKEGRDL